MMIFDNDKSDGNDALYIAIPYTSYTIGNVPFLFHPLLIFFFLFKSSPVSTQPQSSPELTLPPTLLRGFTYYTPSLIPCCIYTYLLTPNTPQESDPMPTAEGLIAFHFNMYKL